MQFNTVVLPRDFEIFSVVSSKCVSEHRYHVTFTVNKRPVCRRPNRPTEKQVDKFNSDICSHYTHTHTRNGISFKYTIESHQLCSKRICDISVGWWEYSNTLWAESVSCFVTFNRSGSANQWFKSVNQQCFKYHSMVSFFHLIIFRWKLKIIFDFSWIFIVELKFARNKQRKLKFGVRFCECVLVIEFTVLYWMKKKNIFGMLSNAIEWCKSTCNLALQHLAIWRKKNFVLLDFYWKLKCRPPKVNKFCVSHRLQHEQGK